MIYTNSRPVVSREFSFLKQISGRLGLLGDSILTGVFFSSVIPRTPRGSEIAPRMFGEFSQRGVDESEAALKREAA